MPDNQAPIDVECEYAFAILKLKDGRFSVGNIDSAKADRQPSIDDVFSAIKIVERDLQVQNTALAVLNAIAQANPNKEESGIVVPEPANKFRKITRENVSQS